MTAVVQVWCKCGAAQLGSTGLRLTEGPSTEGPSTSWLP